MNALQLACLLNDAYGRLYPEDACPFRPASPDGQMAIRVCEEVLKEFSTPLDILRTLNSIIHLGDLVYEVRESEGLNWDGPKVKLWGDACSEMEKLLC